MKSPASGCAKRPPDALQKHFTLLPTSSAPRLLVYPRETVVAEKFQALVVLGLANTRLKDFFDLWTLSQFPFEPVLLRRAVENTFARRHTSLPTRIPSALTPQFTRDPAKVAAWRAFVRRNRLGAVPELEEVADQIAAFLAPMLKEDGR